jgi:hypothetical protein
MDAECDRPACRQHCGILGVSGYSAVMLTIVRRLGFEIVHTMRESVALSMPAS